MAGSLLTPEQRAGFRARVEPLARVFGRVGLTPNGLTVIGLLIACVAGEIEKSQVDHYQGPLYRGGACGTWYAITHGAIADFAVVGEPSGMTLMRAHGGYVWTKITLMGDPKHTVFGEVTDAFTHWFTRLVFSPTVWLGVIVFVVAFVLIGGANMVSRRVNPKPKTKAKKGPADQPKAVGPVTKSDPLIDDEMAEIQAILKKRGIS